MKEYKFEERTIGNILEDKAKTLGEKVYLLHGDIKINYREMNARANSVANSLIGLGIKKGDKVCMIMANSVEFLYAYFALAKIGAVMVPINIALKGNLLKYQMENSDSSVVMVDSDLVDRVVFIQEELKKVKTIIIVPEAEEKKTGFGPILLSRGLTTCMMDLRSALLLMFISTIPSPLSSPPVQQALRKGAVLSHAHYYIVAYLANQYMRYEESSIL